MLTLNDMMEFDCPVYVAPDGSVTKLEEGFYAPSLSDGELDSPNWELLDGFSGQYGYSGPIMHSSEFIGGGLAEYILANPGVYVALVDYAYDEDGLSDDTANGWAIARLIES